MKRYQRAQGYSSIPNKNKNLEHENLNENTDLPIMSLYTQDPHKFLCQKTEFTK